MAEKVEELEDEQRAEIATYTEILAGLKYNKNLLRNLFREEMMRESVIYQDILREGERSLVLRQLTRKVGELSPQMRDRVNNLSLEQIENLGEALLDFQGMDDLEAWLSR